MIVFLTLCYVGLLAFAIKLGLVRLTLWWKLSPLAWMILLLVVLFLPMQWGAPAGKLLILNYVIEVIPNVSGEVTEVRAQPLAPVKKGDILFQIDPRPFQAEVDRLEAAVSAAEQNVPQLKAAYTAATAVLEQSVAQRDLAKINYDRALQIKANDEGAIAQSQVDQTRQLLAAAEGEFEAATALQEERRLAWKAEINGENTRVAELKAQLVGARLNLDWTSVRAPSDGMVVNNFLRKGQRVANFPVRSWMAYQERNAMRIAVAVPQYVLRHVEPGQTAEVVLKMRPGKTYQATVDSIAPLNTGGQVQPSGLVPQFSALSAADQEIAVVLNIDDPSLQNGTLPGGAFGTAAIYTERARMTHVIRRVMLRMESWLNFIVP